MSFTKWFYEMEQEKFTESEMLYQKLVNSYLQYCEEVLWNKNNERRSKVFLSKEFLKEMLELDEIVIPNEVIEMTLENPISSSFIMTYFIELFRQYKTNIFRTKNVLSKTINITRNSIDYSIDFLMEKGVIEKIGSRIRGSKTSYAITEKYIKQIKERKNCVVLNNQLKILHFFVFYGDWEVVDEMGKASFYADINKTEEDNFRITRSLFKNVSMRRYTDIRKKISKIWTPVSNSKLAKKKTPKFDTSERKYWDNFSKDSNFNKNIFSFFRVKTQIKKENCFKRKKWVEKISKDGTSIFSLTKNISFEKKSFCKAKLIFSILGFIKHAKLNKNFMDFVKLKSLRFC